MSLLNYAPSCQRALPIIDTRLPAYALRTLPIINMRLTLLRVYAPLSSSIGALRVFVLSCLVLLQLEGKVCFVCVLQLTIHPLSLSSLLYKARLFYIKLFCMLFFSFVLCHCLYHYLCN